MSPNPARAVVLGMALAATVALAACGSNAASSAPTNPPTTVGRPSTSALPGTSAAPTTASAPTSAAPAQGQVLAVTTMDNMFMGPSSLPAGLTTVQLHNQGPAPHQLQLLRLRDGVSADQAMAAAKTGNPGALLSLATVAGGPNAVAAGHDQQVTVDLPAGTYLEVCFVPDPDGVSHVAKGMVSVLTVSGTAPTGEATNRRRHRQAQRLQVRPPHTVQWPRHAAGDQQRPPAARADHPGAGARQDAWTTPWRSSLRRHTADRRRSATPVAWEPSEPVRPHGSTSIWRPVTMPPSASCPTPRPASRTSCSACPRRSP